jgi:hypothetical protein
MKRIFITTFVFAGLLVSAGHAKNPHKNVHRGGKDASVTIDASFKIFDRDQRSHINRCFERNPKGLPPGLAKRETLPPGLEKHLRKNGTLPPGLQKKVHPFPSACNAGLPRLPDGWVRIVITDRVVLLDAHKRISDWFRISVRIG